MPQDDSHSDPPRACVICRRPVTEWILKLTVEDAKRLFSAFPGITVVDDLERKQYPMPKDCDGSDDVFIGRIREDISSPNGLAFWCVSDNLRKGAATNAVQIAELLVRSKALQNA